MLPSFYHNDYIAKVASLASQHHASEYNRAKFGSRGCITPYLPLSLHAPDQFRDLRQRQESYGLSNPWWIPDAGPDKDQCLALMRLDDVGNYRLRQELIAAMDTPLDAHPPDSPPSIGPPINMPNLSVKTSSSHPINVSSLIPVELIPLLSSHVVLASSNSSVPVLELPSQFHLHRLVDLRQPARTSSRAVHSSNNDRISRCDPLGGTLGLLPNGGDIQAPKSHIRTRSDMTHAMQAAISTGLSLFTPLEDTQPSFLPPPISGREHSICSDNSKLTKKPGKDATTVLFRHRNDSAVSLSLSLSINVNSALDLDLDIYEHSPSSQSLDPSSPSHPPHLVNDMTGCSGLYPMASTLGIPDMLDPPLYIPPLTRSSSLGEEPPSAPFMLGNLLMSSCPGKKVRLQGPVRGRTGVCRDLRADLSRIRALDVRCIVCCLDDAELAYLGAPWHEYLDAAHSSGIDILRIPIPEGLAPLDPPSLDKILTQLIERYTINGVSALVHCRGGVGRAGVIACCWIVKLGLCGWLDEYLAPSGDSSRANKVLGEAWGGGFETLSFVQRIIGFVRQRRSLKAVETYEQVCFLVQYVDYLRRGYGDRIALS